MVALSNTDNKRYTQAMRSTKRGIGKYCHVFADFHYLIRSPLLAMTSATLGSGSGRIAFKPLGIYEPRQLRYLCMYVGS